MRRERPPATPVKKTDAGGGLETRQAPSTRRLLRGDPLRILTEARRLSDEVVRLKFGRSEYHLVLDPGLIQEVLVTKQSFFAKDKYIGIFIPIMKVIRQGLIASPTQFQPHDSMRKLTQPAFHQEMVASYARSITEMGARAAAGWRDGHVVDVHEAMVTATTTIVAKCLFGVDLGRGAAEVGRDLTAIAGYYERLASPLSSLLVRLPSNAKYELAAGRVSRLFKRLVHERRAAGGGSGDLMSMLLAARNDAGQEMTDAQLHDQLGLFFVVGHETSANALAWLWYLLSQNRSVERKLHGEVDRLFPRREVPTVEDIPKLAYTSRVIHETLRVYPSAWSIVRSTSRECKVGRYVLPAGSNVLICQYVNNRDPRVFPEPERFDPDRWSEEFKKGLPPFSFFPFGGGARRCIGEPFAWMEITLLVALLARRWRLRLAPGRVVPKPGISLRPKFGLRMALESR